MQRDRWSRRVIAAAAQVHRTLGPGLLEPVYRIALGAELSSRSIPFEENKTVPIRYRGLVLVTGLQLGLVVGGELIVEALSVEEITEWHRARLLTHLKFSRCPRGVLINFNVDSFQRGVLKVSAPGAQG